MNARQMFRGFLEAIGRAMSPADAAGFADEAMKIIGRSNLPPRRHGRRRELQCALGMNVVRFDAGFNFYEDGTLAEFFARPFHTGRDLEGLLDKFCIGVSLGLQHGMPISEVARAMGLGDEQLTRVTNIEPELPGDLPDMFAALVAAAVQAEIEFKAEMASGEPTP